MSKIAIVYWSGTGNTEAMADFITQGARTQGATVNLIQASDFNSSCIADYDAFAFGCPAMGDEELGDTEFLPMYDTVEPLLKTNAPYCLVHTNGTTASGWNYGKSELEKQASTLLNRLSPTTTPMKKRVSNACALEPCL